MKPKIFLFLLLLSIMGVFAFMVVKRQNAALKNEVALLRNDPQKANDENTV